MTFLSFCTFWIWLAFLSIFDLWAFMCSFFFLDRASLARHLFSLPHCGSYFFGMPSFLSTSPWVMLLWHAIFPLFFFSIAISFCINVWERWIIFKSIDLVKMKDEWMVWKWTMNMCTWSRSCKHEKQLKMVTKFDKAQNDNKQHVWMVDHSSLHAYGFDRCFLSLRNFLF